MLNSVKDYATSMQTKLGETYTTYTSKDKLDAILIEVTSNDTWQVSNQKLLELADMTSGMDGPRIIDHLLLKLKSPNFEWKRILKSLNAIEFILKHGAPAAHGKIQASGYSPMSMLSTFRYEEGSVDRGKQIRDKANLLLDLVNNQHKLDTER